MLKDAMTMQHMQHSTKLGDLLGNYDMVSTLGIPSDVNPEDIDLFSALDMYANTDKMIASIQNNLPLIYSNYGMYGGTSPITEGGTLALLNAELLAGLVFAQLIKEGSKIILGSLPAAFNMSSMGSWYTPSSYLINLACAEIMDYYEIPH